MSWPIGFPREEGVHYSEAVCKIHIEKAFSFGVSFWEAMWPKGQSKIRRRYAVESSNVCIDVRTYY